MISISQRALNAKILAEKKKIEKDIAFSEYNKAVEDPEVSKLDLQKLSEKCAYTAASASTTLYASIAQDEIEASAVDPSATDEDSYEHAKLLAAYYGLMKYQDCGDNRRKAAIAKNMADKIIAKKSP